MTTRRGFLGALLATPALAKLGFGQTPTPLPVPAVPASSVVQGSPILWTPPEAAPFLTMLAKRQRKVTTPKFVWPDKKVLNSKRVVDWEYHNYAQILRQPFGFAGRRPTRRNRAENTLEARWQLIEHRKSIEFALLLGKRGVLARMGGDYSTMGGVQFFTEHYPVHGHLLDYIGHNRDLMQWGEGGFENGRATKYLFVSTSRKRTLGVDEAVSRYGRVNVVATPVLDIPDKEYAFLVDIHHVKLAVLRPTVLMERPNDEDVEYEYLSDVGLEITNPAAHATFLLS